MKVHKDMTMKTCLPIVARFALALLALPACVGAVSSGDANGGDGTSGSGAKSGDVTDGKGPGGGGEGGNAVGACAPAPARLWQLTPEQVVNEIKTLVPGVTLSQPDPLDKGSNGFRNEAATLRLSVPVTEDVVARAELAAEHAYVVRGQLSSCLSNDLAKDSCVTEFIKSFGRRAFRRDLTDAEGKDLLAIFNTRKSASTPEAAFKVLVTTMLASPDFLFRTEIGEGGQSTFALTGYEKASALAFFLTDAGPDDELLTAAASGALDTKAGTAEQVRRLMMSAAGARGMMSFFRQWFELEDVSFLSKDAKVFPSFSDTVAGAMRTEAEMFIESFLQKDGAVWSDLYTSRRTFVNDKLAAFYGLPTGGKTFAATELPGREPRGGLLTLGAVQATLARAYESDPIVRGKFVQEAVLCRHLPPPPANANAFPPAIDPNLTTRERLEQHRADPGCRGCHELLDLVGLGFENYDGVGRYRDTENNKPVDASGSIELDEQEINFVGGAELGKHLADSRDAKMCFATQVLRYATGRSETQNDACLIVRFADELGKEKGSVVDAMVAMLSDETFWTRQAE